jgi:hypothetical protein
MKILTVFLFLSTSVYADLAREVLIKGKVGSTFNDNEVKVVDSFGQIYFLPRSVFPEGFKMKEGEPFAFEVDESILEGKKIIKKK